MGKGAYKTIGGGASKFFPDTKAGVGAKTSFRLSEGGGGNNKFWGSFNKGA